MSSEKRKPFGNGGQNSEGEVEVNGLEKYVNMGKSITNRIT